MYEKFIKRGSKKFGPYRYETYRENGLIKTSYLGKNSPPQKFPAIILSTSILIFLVLFLIYNQSSISGYAISLSKTTFQPNEKINGNFIINLREGELIPSDSSIHVLLDNQENILSLKELIGLSGINLQEQTGNYYSRSASLSGAGLGYGWQGKETEYPAVSFKLEPEILGIQEATSNSIEGSAKYGEEFVYEGIANLVPGSIRTGDKQLSDESISLRKENGKTIISTSYYEETYGFGPAFLNDNEHPISFDLGALNLKPESSGTKTLLIEFSYNNAVLYSDSQSIEVNEEMPVAEMPSIQDAIPPSLNFTYPTPANNAQQSQNYTEINVSISDLDGISEMKFNWNSTNYTFYNDSLVLMMNFDNNSAIGDNATYAVDASKYGNNGTVMSGASWTANGRYGGAYKFDGIDDYISISDNSLMKNLNAFTISVWVYADNYSTTYAHWLGRSDDGMPCGIGYYIGRACALDTNVYTGVGCAAISAGALPLGAWTHYVSVYRGSQDIKIYKNGQLIGTTTDSIPATTGNGAGVIRVGYSIYGGEGFFNGTLDEARLYNRAFSAQEVQQIYYSNLQKFNSTQWYFYSNQSNLSEGDYTYSASAKDSAGNENQTELRTLSIISGADTTPPSINFTAPTPGNGTTTNQIIPVFIQADDTNYKNYSYNIYDSSGFVSNDKYYKEDRGVSAGYHCAYALLNNGNVTSWGQNNYNQSKNYTQGNAIQAAGGGTHACVLLNNGNITCWGGEGAVGNINFGQANNYSQGNAIGVSAGGFHTCALLNNGNITCWGKSTQGQTSAYTQGNAVSVTTGYEFTCALLNNGNITCWGDNTNNQARNYTKGNAIGVSAGSSHTCALLNNGNITCWGYNFNWQANNYTKGDAIGVAGGQDNTCALLNNGNITCWGNPADGRSNNYTQGNAIGVSIGTGYTCALLNNGNITCWGNPADGRSNNYTKGDAKKQSFYVFQNLNTGTYYLNATACDTANNCNSTETRTLDVLGPPDNTFPSAYLISPANKTVLINQTNVTFSCNATDDVKLGNLTLYVWNSSNSIANQTITPVSGTFNQTSWNITLPFDSYKWNCLATDSSGNSNFSRYNWTLNLLAPAPPSLNFTNPTPASGTSTSNTSVVINVSISEQINQSLQEMKFNWNGTNYTFYDDSLVLMMNFDNRSSLGENSTYAVDVSKSGKNGTLINGAIWNSIGKYGPAMQFDGINDYITTPASGVGAGEFTIEAWIQRSNFSAGTNGRIVSNSWGGAENAGFEFLLAGSGYGADQYKLIGVLNPISWMGTGNTVISLGQWHHVAFTYNDAQNSAVIYLDGNVDKSFSVSGSATNAAQNLYIGARNGGDSLNGSIDELRIYNRSLSADEIKQHYQSNLQKYNQTQWYFYSNQSNLSAGTYTYSASAKDNNGENQTETRTITISDVTPPTVYLTSPANNANVSIANQTFICNATNAALANITFYLWNSTNGIVNQTTSAVSGIFNETSINITLPYEDAFKWNCLAIDTSNNPGFASANWTLNYNASRITECRNLALANRTYYLQNNISSAGTCFTISANNTALDCQGYSLKGPSNSGSAYGISSQNYNNLSVKNCNISTFNRGIYYTYGVGGTFINNIITNVSSSFYFQNIDSAYTINNTCVYSSYGFNCQECSRNRIINNTFTSSTGNGYGIDLSATAGDAIGNNITNNNISFNNYGIWLVGSQTHANMIIEGNNLYGNKRGIYYSIGLTDPNTVIRNNNASSNGYDFYSDNGGAGGLNVRVQNLTLKNVVVSFDGINIWVNNSGTSYPDLVNLKNISKYLDIGSTASGGWISWMLLNISYDSSDVLKVKENSLKVYKYLNRWRNDTIDTEVNSGAYSSIALDSSGMPRIAYQTNTLASIYKLKYTAWNGSNWNITTIESSSGSIGDLYVSMALGQNNFPHISYKWGTSLKHAKWNGTSWLNETIDPVSTAETSLALDSHDYPHISYYDATNQDLKLAEWNGTDWNTSIVDSANDVGRYSSIALDSSNYPHISYYSITDGDLKFAEWNGTDWNITTLDSSNDVGKWTSIALDSNDYPHISYFDESVDALKFAEWNGTAWNITTVESGSVGQYTSLSLGPYNNARKYSSGNNYPRISYEAVTNADLKFAEWNGTAWNITAVDTLSNTGFYTSLALDSDYLPHISYMMGGGGGLKYEKFEKWYSVSRSDVDPARRTVFSNITNFSTFGVLGEPIDIIFPNVYLISPLDGTGIAYANQTFTCNATDDIALSNITLYLWNSTNGIVNQTTSIVSGKFNEISINVTLPYDDSYKWNCLATDSSGNSNFSLSNYSLILDTTFPSINFTYPTPANGTSTANKSVEINVSIVESSLGEFKFNWNSTNYNFYDDSLLLMMNFDNNSALGENATYAVDLSKYSNNGIVNGSVWNSSGKYGGAYQFNGNDTRPITIPDSPSLRNPNITIALWIKARWKPEVLSNPQNWPIGKWRDFSYGGESWRLGIYGTGQVRWFWQGLTSGNTDKTNKTIPENEWHHIAITHDSSNARVYIDGILNLTNSSTELNITRTDPIDLGTAINKTGSINSVLNGSIDEVRIWNRALSADEIKQVYQSNLQKFNSTQWYFYSNQSNLSVGTYTYSASTKDSSGNENQTETRYLEILALDITPPSILLISPQNSTITGARAQTFICNATDNIQLSNITLNVWNSTDSLVYNETKNVTGTSNQTTFSNVGLPYVFGNYYWNCLAMDNSSNPAFASSNYTLNVSNTIVSCGSLDIGGANYYMNNSVNIPSAQNCFNINSGSITLDCQGNTINGTGKANGQYGILSGSGGLIIRNCTIQNVNHGIRFVGNGNNKILNSYINNSLYGITSDGAANSEISNVKIENIDNLGITQLGLYSKIDNSSISSSNYGIGLAYSNINITNTNSTGINMFYGISNIDVINCNISAYGIIGTATNPPAYQNIRIINSNVSGSNNGIDFQNDYGIKNSQIINSTITGIASYGIYWYNASGNIIINSRVEGKGDDYISFRGSSNNTATNFTTGNLNLDFVESDIKLNNSYSNPMSSLMNISKYILITNTTSSGNIILNISYSAGDLPAFINEASIKLYKYNGTAWILANTTSDYNGVDALNRKVYANITSFSIFAPLGESSDSISPLINFTHPTPKNGTSTTNKSVEINISIAEKNLNEFKFNWNGTNTTFYDDSLKLMMNFDNRSSLGENSTYIADLSKYGNNGTAINGTLWNSSGKYDGAMQFDGINDYIEIPSSNSLENLTGITVEAWIYPLYPSPLKSLKEYAVVTKYNWPETSYWFGIDWNVSANAYLPDQWIGANSGNGCGDFPGQQCPGWELIPVNAWTHLVWNFDNSSRMLKIYQNDHLTVNVNISNLGYGDADVDIPTYPSVPVRIGASVNYTGSGGLNYFFNGTIDEVRIWNHSLTSDEIKQHYQSNLQKFNSTQWYFYSNQSNLSEGDYTYSAYAKDAPGNENQTELRALNVNYFPTPTLSCSIENSSSCSSGIELLRMKNVSGDFVNAHAQVVNASDYGAEVYNNTLCCSSNYALKNSSGTIFLRLKNYTNSHVQDPTSYSSYPFNAYFGVISPEIHRDVGCDVFAGGCPTNYTCLLSMASISGDNLTNAHVAGCGHYSTEVCCIISSDTPPVSILISPSANHKTNQSNQTFVCNATDDIGLSNLTLYVWNSTGSLNYTNTTQISGILNTSIWNLTLSDDNYAWNCLAHDNISQQAWGNNRSLLIDTINPTIQLVNPTTETGTYSQSWIAANVTSFDTNLNLITVNLYNSTANIQSSSSATSPLFMNFTNLVSGVYYINATANDVVGNSNSTETKTITLDITAPLVSLISPPDTAIVSIAAQRFSCNATNSNLANITFYLWNSTDGIANQTTFLVSGIFNETSTNITLPYDDSYKWNCLAYDNVGNSAFALNNFTIDYNASKITDCQNLTISNRTYYLQNNVSSNGTCFNILAHNIALDCQNYQINYSLNKVGYGVYVESYINSSTIKNCVIKNSNFSYDLHDSYAINLGVSASEDARIANNVITVSGQTRHPIVIGYSKRANITGNNISIIGTCTSTPGIVLQNTKYSIIRSNILNSSCNTFELIYLSSSDYNVIDDNQIYSVSAVPNKDSVKVETGIGNNLTNNLIVVSGSMRGLEFFWAVNSSVINNTILTYGFSSAEGMYLISSNYNTLISNTIKTSGAGAIYISASNHNIFINTTANSTLSKEVYATSNSKNNTFINLMMPLANISGTLKDIEIEGSFMGNVPADSNNIYNISRYLNITNTSSDSSILLNFSYLSSDVPSLLNENSLRIYKWNNSDWILANASDYNGIDNVSKVVYSNITSFSTFAIMGSLLDTMAPNVSLISPSNQSMLNNPLQNFRCNSTDDATLANITLYIWNYTNDKIYSNAKPAIGAFADVNWTFSLPYEGNFSWNCLATDLVNNKSFAPENWTLSIDITFPLIEIYSPENKTYNTAMIFVNISAFGEDNTWFYNGTANETYTTPVYRTFSQGSHTLYAYANDSSGNLNHTLITFFIDSINPSINIVYPQNITYNHNVTSLNYTVSDINLQACWYSLNNGQTNTTIIPCGANLTGLTPNEGSNTWKVYANDSAGNINSSSLTFIVDTTAPVITIIHPSQNEALAAETTETLVNISTNEIAVCRYSNDSAFNFSDGTNFNNTDSLSHSFLFTNMSNGNTYNLYYKCNDSFGNVNPTATLHTFSVSTPQGGGGGGCTPSWTCGGYGSCINGQHTRTCSDGCGSSRTETETCCSESYACGNWGDCINGQQKRTCHDANGCSPDYFEYLACCAANWTCPDFGDCINRNKTRTCSDGCGNTRQETESCQAQQCSDGTLYDLCSLLNKPKFCLNGNLVDRCSPCGCSDGQCLPDGTCGYECTSDDDCDKGYECKNNKCWLEEKECDVDADCPTGKYCSNGECKTLQQAKVEGGGGEAAAAGKVVCTPKWKCNELSECKFTYSVASLLGLNPGQILSGKAERVCVDENKCLSARIESIDCKKELQLKAEREIYCDESYINLYDLNGTLLASIKESKANAVDISLGSLYGLTKEPCIKKEISGELLAPVPTVLANFSKSSLIIALLLLAILTAGEIAILIRKPEEGMIISPAPPKEPEFPDISTEKRIPKSILDKAKEAKISEYNKKLGYIERELSEIKKNLYKTREKELKEKLKIKIIKHPEKTAKKPDLTKLEGELSELKREMHDARHAIREKVPERKISLDSIREEIRKRLPEFKERKEAAKSKEESMLENELDEIRNKIMEAKEAKNLGYSEKTTNLDAAKHELRKQIEEMSSIKKEIPALDSKKIEAKFEKELAEVRRKLEALKKSSEK